MLTATIVRAALAALLLGSSACGIAGGGSGHGSAGASAAVATYPRAIAVGPDGRFAHLTHTSATCSVLDLQQMTGSAPSPTKAGSGS